MTCTNLPRVVIVCAGALIYALQLSSTASLAERPEERPRSVRCLTFSPDGKQLAVVGARSTKDGKLIVWDTSAWQPRWTHGDAVGFPRVAFSPDGKRLALSQFANETKLLESATGNVIGQLRGHTEFARCVAFTPDGQKIVTGSYDKSIVVWNAESHDIEARWTLHKTPVYHVAVSPDGKMVASADSKAGQVFVIDLDSGKQLHCFKDLGSLIPQVGFSPDSRELVVSSWSGDLTLFDSQTFKPTLKLDRSGGGHWAEFSPDGRWLALATNSPTLRLLDVDRSLNANDSHRVDGLLKQFEEDSFAVRERASRELASIGRAAQGRVEAALHSPLAETRVRARRFLRELSRGDSAIQLDGHQDELECVAFSPDSRLLVSGDQQGRILVWRVDDWQRMRELSIND